MELKSHKKPELLLPVGNREMLIAAINNGANAVYYGVPHFNARGRTEDLTFDDVSEMIKYARIRGVRTYLAMNVLIFEKELEQLPKFLEQIISLSPDAFIIQDLGLAKMVRAICPTQEIHASTQMTLSSAEGINLIKNLGFNRAVLARELSLNQIAAIKRETDLQLEVFIHGALCVSYSGQCLTSENFGGRSANRGQCAQSCRLPYKIFVDGIYKKCPPYIFSPRDLCALPILNDLTKIGVDSLKVEGRLKSAEYVAAVANAYNKQLNNIECDANDIQPLEVLFSRGLSTGFLKGDNHQELVDGTYSNHHGMHLGTVKKISGKSVFIQNNFKYNEPKPGDGILFEDENLNSIGARLYACKISKDNIALEFSNNFDLSKVHIGDKVFLNDSPTIEANLRKTFTSRNSDKKIGIDVEFFAAPKQKVKLTLTDEFKNSVNVEGEVLEPTTKSDFDIKKLAQKELSALSATAYKLQNLKINISENIFITGKCMRYLRQRATAALDNARLKVTQIAPNANKGYELFSHIKNLPNKKSSAKNFISVLVRNPLQIKMLKGLNIDAVIMDFDWGVSYDIPMQKIRDMGFKAGIATLRIHKPGENRYLKDILRLLPDIALVRNLGALAVLKKTGITLVGDYSLNATNSLSFNWLLEQGLSALHPSWDLNANRLFELIQNIDSSKMELALHQYMPAFHTEYCAFARMLTKGRFYPECGKACTLHKVEILDHKGCSHFLQSDAECRNTLFVGKPQSALKLLPDLKNARVNRFRLEMLNENADIVQKKVQIYTAAINEKISIDEAILKARVQETYGLTDGQLFNTNIWQDRKK